MGRSNLEALRAAWRALAAAPKGDGWQTISVAIRTPCSLSAGRRWPSGEEAVLVRFHGVPADHDAKLPQGNGFEVLRFQSDPVAGKDFTVALARRSGGSSELFAMMAEDLVGLLDEWAAARESMVLRQFLARISAWQEFMGRHRDHVLSEENELGLIGELVLVGKLIEAGLPARDVLNAWEGPADGVQDFVLGSGAIEVKTTLAAGTFPATVSSLEQLDDGIRKPLFVAAVRLALHSGGQTLPQVVEDIRARLATNREALETLEIRLMQAGLLHASLRRYKRRFHRVSESLLPVQGDFPRLVRANVHPLVRRARYEIDLEFTSSGPIDLKEALKLMGAM